MENETIAPQEQVPFFIIFKIILHFEGVQRGLFGVKGKKTVGL